MTAALEAPRLTWGDRRRQAADEVRGSGSTTARSALWRLALDATSPVERAAVLSDLAALAAAQGHVPAARLGFQRALRLNPGYSPAQQNLSMLASSRSQSESNAGSSTRPRIAILSLLFNWPSTAGGTVHTKELVEQLQVAGYDVRHIYAVHEPWGLGRVTEPLSVRCVPLVFDEFAWNAETIQNRFREAVDDFAPDAVIITDSWNTKPLLAETVAGYPYFLRLAALETICPLNNVRLLFEGGCLVQCLRNQLVEPDSCRACVQKQAGSSGGLHQAERQLAGFFEDDYSDRLRRAYSGAEAVLGVNPTIADLVRPFCRQVQVIPSGFDPARFPEPNFDLSDKDASLPTRFLFAGLVDEPMKGFAILWEACRQLWFQRQDFELVVTSDPRRDWDAPFIRWIGWQSQAELPQAIRECDVLVFPTLAQEALGRTAVEGMGCGKPVIASRLGGLPWVVEDGETGLLVNAGDPADLNSKLMQLLDDPELRARLGQAGRVKFERDFPWPVILDRHYRPLLKQFVAQHQPVG